MLRGHAPLALIALVFLATSCADSPGAGEDVPEVVTGADLVEVGPHDVAEGADGDVAEGVTGPDLVEVGPHEVAEVEPNEDPEHATRFEAGDTLVGRISAAGSPRDTDTWVARLEGGTFLTLTVELPAGEHRLQLAIAYAGPLTIPFMDGEITLTMVPKILDQSPSGIPHRFFIPRSGDYFVTVVDQGSDAVAYRVATAGETPIPVPLDSTLPVELPPHTPYQQTVYRFTAPTDVVVLVNSCRNDGVGALVWSPGAPWAYHPDDAGVRVVFGGTCGVPLRKGQTALLVSPYYGADSFRTVHDDQLFPLPVGLGAVIDGDLLAEDPGDHFFLDDLSDASVTLTLETEPPTGDACLWLAGLYRYDRHGLYLWPLGYEAVAGADGRATLTFTPGVIGLLADEHSVYFGVGSCGGGPLDARPTFGYRLSVTSVGLELTPVPPDGALALDLGADETRYLETTVAPESCTYGQALVDLERSRPITLMTKHACDEDFFMCASAESGPQRALLGVAAMDGVPAQVHLHLASHPLVPPDAPVVEDAADNGPDGTPQRLVPPVVVALGPAAVSSQDRFRVALSGGEVVLVTLDRAALPDPACSWYVAGVRLARSDDSSRDVGCERFPTHPEWNPMDVGWVVSSDLVWPRVYAYRAPAPMDLDLQVFKSDIGCSTRKLYTLGLTVLPPPILGPP
jgi:hypothetical protein